MPVPTRLLWSVWPGPLASGCPSISSQDVDSCRLSAASHWAQMTMMSLPPPSRAEHPLPAPHQYLLGILCLWKLMNKNNKTERVKPGSSRWSVGVWAPARRSDSNTQATWTDTRVLRAALSCPWDPGSSGPLSVSGEAAGTKVPGQTRCGPFRARTSCPLSSGASP